MQSLAANESEEIEGLVTKLGSDSFQVRESAMDSLRAIGRAAVPALRKAEKSPDLEIRRRARILVQELDEGIQPLLDRKATILYSGKQKGSPASVDSVSMSGPNFADKDLIHLREFTNLHSLDLSVSRISNAGLVRIEGLSNLQQLFLFRTNVSDLTSVGKLTKLTHLYLGGTKITDEKLASIKDLGDLWSLDLCHTNISDPGLAHLRNLKHLYGLTLSSTNITDKGLVHLEGLTELTYLRLDGTEISDAGLVHLKKLKKLERVYLHRTKTTMKGVEDLKKSLPEWINHRSSR
jgi:hypothetical protein